MPRDGEVPCPHRWPAGRSGRVPAAVPRLAPDLAPVVSNVTSSSIWPHLHYSAGFLSFPMNGCAVIKVHLMPPCSHVTWFRLGVHRMYWKESSGNCRRLRVRFLGRGETTCFWAVKNRSSHVDVTKCGIAAPGFPREAVSARQPWRLTGYCPWVCLCVHVCVHLCVRTGVHACTCAPVCLCVCTHVHACVYMCLWGCAHVRHGGGLEGKEECKWPSSLQLFFSGPKTWKKNRTKSDRCQHLSRAWLLSWVAIKIENVLIFVRGRGSRSMVCWFVSFLTALLFPVG